MLSYLTRFSTQRLREPSTYAGLAGVVSGLGVLFAAPELQTAAAVAEAAAHAAGSGQDLLGIGLTALGAAAVLLRDPGSPR